MSLSSISASPLIANRPVIRARRTRRRRTPATQRRSRATTPQRGIGCGRGHWRSIPPVMWWPTPIGGLIYSGIGGQKDFVRGARLSTGGKAITALPSTAKGGSVSRILPTIKPDAGVTTRGHMQYVATENGVVNLGAEFAPGGAADRHLPSRFPARVRAAAVACHHSLPPAPKGTATHLTVPGRRSRIAADRG